MYALFCSLYICPSSPAFPRDQLLKICVKYYFTHFFLPPLPPHFLICWNFLLISLLVDISQKKKNNPTNGERRDNQTFEGKVYFYREFHSCYLVIAREIEIQCLYNLCIVLLNSIAQGITWVILRYHASTIIYGI